MTELDLLGVLTDALALLLVLAVVGALELECSRHVAIFADLALDMAVWQQRLLPLFPKVLKMLRTDNMIARGLKKCTKLVCVSRVV